MEKKEVRKITINSIIIVLILILVSIPDFMSINYWIKAVIKVSLFLIIPIILLKIENEPIDLLLKSSKKTILISLSVGIIMMSLVVIGYFLLRQIIDFSNIPEALENGMGVTKDNFYLVFLYIPIVNAFIEEFFFRNFIHQRFSKALGYKTVIILSAILFAVYHITIMNNWGSPLVIALAILGLFIVGMFLSYIREKTQSIFPTYVMHSCANIGINIAALFILGIV